MKARELVRSRAAGQTVTIEPFGKDRWGITIARVYLPGGWCLNEGIVKAGYGWWYRKYAPGDEVLEALEKEAREAKRGLWADKEPVPPWEWRRKQTKTL